MDTHTFLQIRIWADFIYMNPGSVSIPKENSAHGYMIYDQEFIWKDLDGNVIDMM